VSIWRSCLLVRRRCYEEKLDRNISARPELKVVAVSTHTPSSVTPATTPGPFPSTAFPYPRNLAPKTNQTKAQPKTIHTSLHHRIQRASPHTNILKRTRHPSTNLVGVPASAEIRSTRVFWGFKRLSVRL